MKMRFMDRFGMVLAALVCVGLAILVAASPMEVDPRFIPVEAAMRFRHYFEAGATFLALYLAVLHLLSRPRNNNRKTSPARLVFHI
jgi:hypothetical protein